MSPMRRASLDVTTLCLLAGLAACNHGGQGVPHAEPNAATTARLEQSAPAEVPGQVRAPDSDVTTLVPLPRLTYRTLFPGKDEAKEVAVAPFAIEAHAVTNGQFLAFVRAQPKWQRSAVPAVFAESGYLRHWRSDLELADDDADRPVVNVSWFAARAYAQWCGRRLPTLAEWEAIAGVGLRNLDARTEPDHNQRILDWYARPAGAALLPVASTPTNVLGVADLHGVVWEWVDDFNSALVTGESRGDSALERSMFCGNGALGAADPRDYAAFMRQAFRSGLRAAYVVGSLGFRCAADTPTR